MREIAVSGYNQIVKNAGNISEGIAEANADKKKEIKCGECEKSKRSDIILATRNGNRPSLGSLSPRTKLRSDLRMICALLYIHCVIFIPSVPL